MKKTIRFSKLFLPAAIFSVCLTVAGLASFIVKGFNLGVDFQPGVIQEVQFAPTAFSLTWSGRGNAKIFFDSGSMSIDVSGLGVVSQDPYTFPFSEYPTLGSLYEALEAVEGLGVELKMDEKISSRWLLRSEQQLGTVPYLVHYLNTEQSDPIEIAAVREAFSSLGHTVSVQSLKNPSDRYFMIRDRQEEESSAAAAARGIRALELFLEEENADIPLDTQDLMNRFVKDVSLAVNESLALSVNQSIGNDVSILSILEDRFGAGEVIVHSTNKVDLRFSKNLTDQVALLIGLTLLVMLVYVTIRFKPQYGIGLVIGIIHDALVIVAFVVWTGMEFNTTTIAAILTIVGYSTNNTIVVFDRIREVRRIYPDESFINVLNMSLTATLNRTIITTVTTMLAVMSLYIFTTGSMKDFALALQVGMISGVYTTIFIVSGFVNFWEQQKLKREKVKLTGQPPVRNMTVSKV